MKNKIILVFMFLSSVVFASGKVDLTTCQWSDDTTLSDNYKEVFLKANQAPSATASCSGTVMCGTASSKNERVVFGHVSCPFSANESKDLSKNCNPTVCLSIKAPKWLEHSFDQINSMAPKIVDLSKNPEPTKDLKVEEKIKKIEFTNCKWIYGPEPDEIDVMVEGKYITTKCFGEVDCYIPDYDNKVKFHHVMCDKKDSNSCEPNQCLNVKDMNLDSKYLTKPHFLSPLVSGMKIIDAREVKKKTEGVK